MEFLGKTMLSYRYGIMAILLLTLSLLQMLLQIMGRVL